MRTGVASLPLHYGKAPAWLFKRMVKLARAISETIIYEYGRKEFLKRLSDPFFFQSFANVLAWDWHSSGSTPVLCGALKEAHIEEFGIFVAGGKGKTSRKTPQQIEKFGNGANLSTKSIGDLTYASRMIAKVDNSLIQDSYQLYTHSFFFTEDGKNYCVIQQGMNTQVRYARRYHWLSDNVDSFIEEHPVCCDRKEDAVLDMTAEISAESRKISLDLVRDNPAHMMKYVSGQQALTDYQVTGFKMPERHWIAGMNRRNIETLHKAYEFQPRTYEELVAIKGIGPKTIRSLALISELVYGAKPSWNDPVRYSFAHGGKDKIPYPVNKEVMDCSTEILRNAVKQAKLGAKDKLHTLERLKNKL